MIDFSPLFETMKEKGISQYQLLKMGVDRKTLDSFRKNRNVTLLTVERVARLLDTDIQHIVRFKE